MLNCFENYGRYSLHFDAGRNVIRKDSPEKPSADPSADLAWLRAKVDKIKKPKQPSTGRTAPAETRGTHTMYHKDTRDIGETKPRYKGTAEAAEKALKQGEYLSPQEVVKIKGLHEHMYEHYLNPAFMLYVQRKPGDTFEKVYKSLELIFANPYDFEYISMPGDRTEIHKRGTSKKTEIDENFSVVMETRAGYITNVNGIDLKDDKGGIPWMLQPEYQKQMVNYAERWQVESEKTGVPVSEEMKAIFMLNNVTFPKKFLDLVENRDFEFEKKDPQIEKLKIAQSQQGTTYDEITKNEDTKWWVGVEQDTEPGNEGGYQIHIKTVGGGQETLHISKEGFIMRDQGPTGSPSWIPDPMYDNAVRWKYYTEHPGAEKTLDPDDLTKMKADRAQAEINKKELEKREKRRKVDEALPKADFVTLKGCALAVIDENEPTTDIDNAKDTPEDRAFLIQGIQYYMDPAKVGEKKASDNLDTVAEILKVSPATPAPVTPPAPSLPTPAPDTPPDTPPRTA